MIDHTSSLNGVTSAFKWPHYPLENPDNQIALLRNPTIYKGGREPLENSFLEDLIKQNIFKRSNDITHDDRFTFHEKIIAKINACDARALYNSLSKEGRKKFEAIVQSFYIAITKDTAHDRNKKMLEEMMEMYQGGEIRVVCETGFRMILKVLFDLLGVKPKHFYGVSAGAFQAAGRAFGAPNCIAVANTIDTDYSKVTESRKHLETWINDLIKEAYLYTTGKKEHDIEDGIIRVKHLEEAGTDLKVLVGEITKYFPPKMENYFLPEELKTRFGKKNPGNLPLAPMIAASANLWLLFFLIDPTFGRCFIKDSKGLNHYLLDAGGLDRANGIPFNDFEDEMKKYLNGKRELPPFVLIAGNTRVESLEKSIFDKIADRIDSLFIDPIDKIKTLGAERLYIKGFCGVDDPFIKGNTSVIRTGHLNVSAHDKAVLTTANLSTSDFPECTFQGQNLKPSLHQLYENFVFINEKGIKEYIESNGQAGKSPLQLWIDDAGELKAVKKAEKLPEEIIPIDKAAFEARMLWSAGC